MPISCAESGGTKLWSKGSRTVGRGKAVLYSASLALGLTMHPLGAKGGHSGFIAAEERDRSKANLWHKLYLGLYAFLGVKWFARCPDRHGSEAYL